MITVHHDPNDSSAAPWIDLEGGFRGYYWDESHIWFVDLGAGLDIAFYGFNGGREKAAEFASKWSERAARACSTHKMTADQWWAAVESVS